MAVPIAALMAAKEGAEVLKGVVDSARERSEAMEARPGSPAQKNFIIDRLLDVMDSENAMNLKGPEATAHKEANKQLGKLNSPSQSDMLKGAAQLGQQFAKKGVKGPGM